MNMRYKNEIRLGAMAVLASIVLGVSATGVRADSHAGYTPSPKGTELTWARGKTADKAVKELFRHRVIGADAEDVVYLVKTKGKAGDRVRLFRGLFSYAYWRPGVAWIEYKFDRASLRKLWPLAPGKEARVKIRFGYGLGKTIEQAKANWKQTETGEIFYRVLRREKITVPAGTFDAFVIQRDRWFTKQEDGGKTYERRIGWLAPKLGYVVRQSVHKDATGAKTKEFVLQVISVKRPSSAK